MEGLRRLFILLLRSHESPYDMVYLRDLINTNHTYLLLLEEWISRGYVSSTLSMLSHIKQWVLFFHFCLSPLKLTTLPIAFLCLFQCLPNCATLPSTFLYLFLYLPSVTSLSAAFHNVRQPCLSSLLRVVLFLSLCVWLLCLALFFAFFCLCLTL